MLVLIWMPIMANITWFFVVDVPFDMQWSFMILGLGLIYFGMQKFSRNKWTIINIIFIRLYYFLIGGVTIYMGYLDYLIKIKP